jgi:hypothetical protein
MSTGLWNVDKSVESSFIRGVVWSVGQRDIWPLQGRCAIAQQMTADAVEGINARQIDAFNSSYKAAPSNFTLGINGRSLWEGRGLGNLGKVGQR